MFPPVTAPTLRRDRVVVEIGREPVQVGETAAVDLIMAITAPMP
jgi:hypothetical protein